MTREDIIRMARESGGVFIDPPCGDCYTFDIDDGTLERFAELIASDERERIITANAPEIEKVNKELRRLHEVNQELLGALNWCAETLAVFVDNGSAAPDSVIGKNLITARAAIAKAGEKP